MRAQEWRPNKVIRNYVKLMWPQWFPTLTSPLPSLHYCPYPPAHTLLSCSPFVHLCLASSSLTRSHLHFSAHPELALCRSPSLAIDFASIESPRHHLALSDSEVQDSVECLPFPGHLHARKYHLICMFLCSSRFHADHLELKGPIPGGSLLLFALPGSLLVATRHLFPPFLSLVRPFLWLSRQSSEIEGRVPCSVSISPGILPPQTLPNHYSLTTSPALPSSFLVYPNNHFQHNFFLSVHPTLVIHKDVSLILYIFSLPLTLVLPCIHNDI